MTAVSEAFRWARVHAVRHMAVCEEAGLRWGETAITETVISRAARAVTVVPFTQSAEALSGADWVWWWIDRQGAYGMLVQAKRVTMSRGKWAFDFGYPSGTGAQRSALMSTAAALNLLPVYALYLGTGFYRQWARCTAQHRGGRCLQCVKRSVSLMPALLAQSPFVNNAATTYERSVALEDLWLPPTSRALVIPTIKKKMVPNLSEFFTSPQTGVRAVTRAMTDRVIRVRAGQLSVATTGHTEINQQGAHDRLGPVFGEVPDDEGHWGLNYFEHLLTPFRQVPPGYVLNVASGDFSVDSVASEMPGSVAGVVVVDLHPAT